MSLPENWVDRIFSKLSVVYGHQFLSRWDGIPIDAVKADWGKELSAYQQSPNAITYGLENLPTKPPTVIEFRDICRRAPPKPIIEQQAQISHAACPVDPDVVRQAIGEIRSKPSNSSHLRWAKAMEARDQRRPQEVTPAMRAMYRAALKLDAAA